MARRIGTRDAKSEKVLIIVCDGERTEDSYFCNWKAFLGPTRIVIRNFNVRSGGNPLKAVRAAAKLKRGERDFHELWCVCDVDNTSKEQVAEAKVVATREGIKLCLSKRCFEVWLALHFERSTRSVTSEQEAISLVRKHIPTYADRVKVAPFSLLLPRSEDACGNASWLEERGLDDPQTDVHQLVRQLLAEADRSGVPIARAVR